MPNHPTIKVTLKDDVLGTLSLHTFTLNDAFVLKNTTGLTFNQMFNGIDDREPASFQALVWYLKWKRGEQNELLAIDFPLGDLTVEVVENPTEARTGTSETATSDSSPTTAD